MIEVGPQYHLIINYFTKCFIINNITLSYKHLIYNTLTINKICNRCTQHCANFNRFTCLVVTFCCNFHCLFLCDCRIINCDSHFVYLSTENLFRILFPYHVYIISHKPNSVNSFLSFFLMFL